MGRDRISGREGFYFDVVHPFQRHSRSPDTRINQYLSFRIIAAHNISGIDHAMLQLVLSSAAISVGNMAQARVHVINYNALSITDRMLDIAYAN